MSVSFWGNIFLWEVKKLIIDLILFVSFRVGGFTRSGKENDLISFPTCPVDKYSRIRLDCKSD